MPWRGPAGAQRPPHGGDYSASGNERAKPLAFPPGKETAPIRCSQRRASGSLKRAPSHGATPPVRCRQAERTTRLLPRRGSAAVEASARPALTGKERGESASGSAQETPHPQERAARDRVRPPILPLTIICSRSSPEGPRLQAWCAQRIERVARKGSHILCASFKEIGRIGTRQRAKGIPNASH